MDWLGPAIVALVLVIIGPVALFAGGAIWSAVFGFFGIDDAEVRHEDSDWVKHRAW